MLRKNYIHNSKYFWGNEISDYGLENGYVDYATLSNSFDCVLNNNIIQETTIDGTEWEVVNGSEIQFYDKEIEEYVEYDEIENWDNIEESYKEIYQYYIISYHGFDILYELTDEIVFYNKKLDMYVWGITHYGTSWHYVLTNIPVKLSDEK